MTLKLNDVFYTIQGEGANTGKAAIFVRMPFCNLNCPWCDTEFYSYQDWQEQDLLSFMEKSPGTLVVITGGEPSMNKDTPQVIELAKKANKMVAMESNGQFVAPSGVDFLTISPKRWSAKVGEAQSHSPFWWHPENKPSEIKLVVDNEDVLQFAQTLSSDKAQHFFLSPEWETREKWIPKMVDFVKENPQWKISLQTHKILNVE